MTRTNGHALTLGNSTLAPTADKQGKPFPISAFLLTVYVFTIAAFSYQAKSVEFSTLAGYLLVGAYFAELFKYQRIIIPGLMVPLILFVLWSGLSVFWSIDTEWALLRTRTLFQLLLLSIVALNILNSRKSTRPVMYGIIFGAIWAIWGSLSSNNFDIFRQQTTKLPREGSFLVNSNIYGIHLNLAIFFLLTVFFEVRSLFIKVLLVGIIVLAATQVVFYTGSRKGLLGLLFLGFLYLSIYFLVNKHHNIELILLFLLFIVLISNFTLLLEQLPYGDRFLYIEGDTSFLTREAMIKTGLHLWAKEPIVGYGLEQYRVVSGFGMYAHNNYIELLVDGGLISFLLYYSTLFLLIIQYWRRFRVGWLKYQDTAFGIAIILWFIIFDAATVSFSEKTYWLLFVLAINGVTSTRDDMPRSAGHVPA